MRRFLLFLMLFTSISVYGEELEQAYKKEYAYLVAEKEALQQRLESLTQRQKKNINKVVAEIEQLQQRFLKQQNLTDRLNRQIVEASRDVDVVENDSVLLDTTMSQATESLKKLDKDVGQGLDQHEQLKQAFAFANEVITSDGKVESTTGKYFKSDGEAIDGTLISVGRIAKYGVSSEGGGVLAPAGNGQFKIWDPTTGNTATQLTENLYPATLPVFLYENTEKGIEKEDQKTLEDDIEASGIVGVVIITLGAVGIVLVLIRIYLLQRASSNIHKTVKSINQEMEQGDVNSALEYCKQKTSAVCNVIAATLRSLHKERDHLEDIISESILHESSVIDRFATAIIVIAAISPLLGLLGTVTGMISTFDIITEFGTGDPKLLSSGISEALLTTKLGLIVAIPLLVMGNLLSSWGQRIKNELEQAALHIINTQKA